VGELSDHIDGAGFLIKGIQIIGKALPGPFDPIGQGRSWDVLYTFHELNQKILLPRPDGGEANAAISHHNRGNAMVSRGRQAIIPSCLAVIVGVGINKPRGDDTANGVNDFDIAALGGICGQRFAQGHHSINLSVPNEYIADIRCFPRTVDDKTSLN